MSTMRYERLSNPDPFEEANVYNTEQIGGTILYVTNNDDNFLQTFFNDRFNWPNIFHDYYHSQLQKRICTSIIILMTSITSILLILLFLGFGKVIFDIIAYQERSRHGLMMIPNIRKQPLNVFYFNLKNETTNAKYANEIDDYLKKYISKQEMLKEFTKICTAQQQSDKNHWCSFNIEQQFHSSDCSKTTNYGYNSGNPCILFIFDNRLGWKPKMRNEMDYLPFLCHMGYQYSSNIYTNVTYYPPLQTTVRSGGFQMNLIPSQKITDENGNEIVGEDGNIFYTLPPMIMVKMSFRNASKGTENGNDNIDRSVDDDNNIDDFGPFTMDCRIEDYVEGYQFDNIKDFKGQTAISFDFVPFETKQSSKK